MFKPALVQDGIACALFAVDDVAVARADIEG